MGRLRLLLEERVLGRGAELAQVPFEHLGLVTFPVRFVQEAAQDADDERDDAGFDDLCSANPVPVVAQQPRVSPRRLLKCANDSPDAFATPDANVDDALERQAPSPQRMLLFLGQPDPGRDRTDLGDAVDGRCGRGGGERGRR